MDCIYIQYERYYQSCPLLLVFPLYKALQWTDILLTLMKVLLTLQLTYLCGTVPRYQPANGKNCGQDLFIPSSVYSNGWPVTARRPSNKHHVHVWYIVVITRSRKMSDVLLCERWHSPFQPRSQLNSQFCS